MGEGDGPAVSVQTRASRLAPSFPVLLSSNTRNTPAPTSIKGALWSTRVRERVVI